MAVPLGIWRVDIPGGETYTFDPDGLTMGEMYTLESELGGMSFLQWLDGINDRRAAAIQILVWFLRRQAGKPQDRGSVDVPPRKVDLNRTDLPPDPESPAGTEPASDSGSSSPTVSTD